MVYAAGSRQCINCTFFCEDLGAFWFLIVESSMSRTSECNLKILLDLFDAFMIEGTSVPPFYLFVSNVVS